MSSPEYDKLQEAISQYKSAVDVTLSDLRRPLYLDLVVIVIIPITLVIVAAIWSNIVGVLAALGIGGINAGDRLRRGQTILTTYWGDCSRLKKSIRRLEIELQLCTPHTRVRLQNVEKLLRDYLSALPE